MSDTSKPPANGSQQDHGRCPYCYGAGKVRVQMSTGPEASKEFACPKCGGTGSSAKITTK